VPERSALRELLKRSEEAGIEFLREELDGMARGPGK
jgi:hypothetical protein